MKDKKSIGNCPICDRPMIQGPSVNGHHFIPKSKGGEIEDKIMLHKVCHDKLHRVFTISELRSYYNTPEKCLENEDIIKFKKWLKNKPPEYIDKVIKTRKK